MLYTSSDVNPPCGLAGKPTAQTDLRSSFDTGWSNLNKETSMATRHEKREEKEKQALEQYERWRDASQSHWNHWRAWGSWFSWGSPVGLGLLFLLLAVAAAVLIWAIKL